MFKEISFLKNGETYVFRYKIGEENVLIKELFVKAQDPSCLLNWFDIGVLVEYMGLSIDEYVNIFNKGVF